MSDDELRTTVLKTLGMLDAPKELQDEALAKVESIAEKRLTLALPEMVTDEQMEQVEAMRKAGKDDDIIMQWVEDQIPQYGEMLRAVIQDVADEVAE